MNILTFIFSPILLIIGFVVGTEIAKWLGLRTDIDDKIFVIIILVALYISGINTAYRTLIRTEQKGKIQSK